MTTYAITNGTQELFTDNIELIYAVKQLLLQFTTDFEIGTEDGTVIWSRSDGMVDTIPVPEQLNPQIFGLAAAFVMLFTEIPIYGYQDKAETYYLLVEPMGIKDLVLDIELGDQRYANNPRIISTATTPRTGMETN